MAQCNYCGKKGIFLSVSKHGLCSSCEPAVMQAIGRHADIIQESLDIINNTKNFNTRIGRIDTVNQNIDILEDEYLSRGIMVNDLDSDDLRGDLEDLRNASIEEEVLNKVQKNMDKASLVKTATAKVNNANKALLVLKEFNNDYGYINEQKVEEIKRFIYESQLNEHIQKAEKEEFKGNDKKALDSFTEALYLTKNDGVGNQSETIKHLTDKVNEIKNKKNKQLK